MLRKHFNDKQRLDSEVFIRWIEKRNNLLDSSKVYQLLAGFTMFILAQQVSAEVQSLHDNWWSVHCWDAFGGMAHDVEGNQLQNIGLASACKDAEFFQDVFSDGSVETMPIQLSWPCKNLVVSFWLTNESESSIIRIDSLFITLILPYQSITLVGQLIAEQSLLELCIFTLKVGYLIDEL